MDVRLLITGAMLSALMSGTPAILHAQSSCMAYEPLRRVMQENGIRLEGGGKIPLRDGTSTAIEVWVSPKGDFAFVAVDSNGIACLILSGTGWKRPEGL